MSETPVIDRLDGVLAEALPDPVSLADDDLVEGLAVEARLRSRLAAWRLHLTAEIDRRAMAPGRGRVTTAHLLSATTGESLRSSRDTVTLASRLGQLAATGEALGRGEITLDHARALSRLDAVSPADERALVDRARVEGADEFRQTVDRHRRSTDDPADLETRRRRQRASARCHVGASDDEMVTVFATLDPISGAELTDRLERATRRQFRDAVGDDRHRPIAWHRARALAALVGGGGPIAGDPRRAVVAVIDHRTLMGQLAEHPECALLDGTPITPTEARQLAARHGIIPAVLGSDGAVLDLGRRARCATPDQVTALTVQQRDDIRRGHVDPVWAQAHHDRQRWADGGRTDLRELRLVDPVEHAAHHARAGAAPERRRSPGARAAVVRAGRPVRHDPPGASIPGPAP